MENTWDTEDLIRSNWDNFWSTEIKDRLLAQFGHSVDTDTRYMTDAELENCDYEVRCYNGRDPECDVPEIEVVIATCSDDEFDTLEDAYRASLEALLDEWDHGLIWEMVCNPNRNAVRECAEAEEQARAAAAGRA